MRIKYECLPCLVNQAVRVAEITNAGDRDLLFQKVFAYLSTLDFSKSNPEVIGETFRLLKAHIKNEDPYRETRAYYNQLFLNLLDSFEAKINRAENPMEEAVKYAILGNIIDFNPIHNTSMEDILQWFENANHCQLTVNHLKNLCGDLASAKRLLYLGDNCGEICLDKLLIKKIKEQYPGLELYFGVRGASVVNDSVEADAYFVGMDKYASIISNGDDSLGTVLTRTSENFRRVYQTADVVIAKGQANYESLSEETKNIYFLLMSKCEVIAADIGVKQKSLICMSALRKTEK